MLLYISYMEDVVHSAPAEGTLAGTSSKATAPSDAAAAAAAAAGGTAGAGI
jgi:hypothetical protein